MDCAPTVIDSKLNSSLLEKNYVSDAQDVADGDSVYSIAMESVGTVIELDTTSLVSSLRKRLSYALNDKISLTLAPIGIHFHLEVILDDQ